MGSPILTGAGVGLRPCHYASIETDRPDLAWFEVLSDNYLDDNGPGLSHLEKIRAAYPMTLHGVGMSLGSTDPINFSYLHKLKRLITRFEPTIVSDHLCWTSFANQYFHELLPLPYTQEAILHCASRIRQVQDFLGQRILIENVSSYLCFKHSEFTEWQFLQYVAEEADCLILLDINNIYVSANNNGFNPDDYLDLLSTDRVAQFHLAGFEDHHSYLLDNHGTAIDAAVWQLYIKALKKFGSQPTIIERDNQIPQLDLLIAEAKIARHLMEKNLP